MQQVLVLQRSPIELKKYLLFFYEVKSPLEWKLNRKIHSKDKNVAGVRNEACTLTLNP